MSPNLATWLSSCTIAFFSSWWSWKRKKLSSTKKEAWNSKGDPLADGFWLKSLPFAHFVVSILIFGEVGELDWLSIYFECL